MNFFIRSIIFILLGVFSLTATAQSKRVEKTVENRQAQLEKQDEQKKAAAEKEQEMLKQKHIDMQTKAVQKRMKKARKKAKRYNDNKKEFFLTRWFRKK